MADGYYLMYRGWLDHHVYGGEAFDRRSAWCWLIENAAFEPHIVSVKGRQVDLKRGQLCHSLRFLADRWRWELTRVLRFMRRLVAASMIHYDVCNGQALITINNYDVYQVRAGLPTTENATTPQQQCNGDATKNKEGKEGKEGNKKDTLPPGGGDPPPQADLLGQDDFSSARFPTKADVDLAVAAYNELALAVQGVVAKVVKPKERALRARLSECGSLQAWQDVMNRIRKSKFLSGRAQPSHGRQPFRLKLDFVVSATNFAKILEGCYDDAPGAERGGEFSYRGVL